MNNIILALKMLVTSIVCFLVSLVIISAPSYAITTMPQEKPHTLQTVYNNDKDPLERINRPIFSFNEKMDRWFLKPIATLYNAIMPKPLNQGVHNAFLNLNEIPTIANDILQLHFQQMANDAWRLGINSTIGILGLFDVATRMGLPYYSNDFGLTLGYWGYTNSTYIVLPFWGPYTFRDAIPVDYFVFSIYPLIPDQWNRYELYALSIVDSRAHLLQYQSVFDEAAIDKYVFVRNAYLQRRSYLINQNLQLGSVIMGGPGQNK